MVYAKLKQVIILVLSKPERVLLRKTHLRNLKRKYAKMKQHPDLAEECIDLKADIDALERELNS